MAIKPVEILIKARDEASGIFGTLLCGDAVPADTSTQAAARRGFEMLAILRAYGQAA